MTVDAEGRRGPDLDLDDEPRRVRRERRDPELGLLVVVGLPDLERRIAEAVPRRRRHVQQARAAAEARIAGRKVHERAVDRIARHRGVESDRLPVLEPVRALNLRHRDLDAVETSTRDLDRVDRVGLQAAAVRRERSGGQVADLALHVRRKVAGVGVAHDREPIAVLADGTAGAEDAVAAVERGRVAEAEAVAELVSDDEVVGLLVDPGLRSAAEPPPAARNVGKDVDALVVAVGVVAGVGRAGVGLRRDGDVVAGGGRRHRGGQPGRDDSRERVAPVRSLGEVFRDAVVSEHPGSPSAARCTARSRCR